MSTTQAAAILLLQNEATPQVLLGRRAPTMLFLGNYWAFIGGTQSQQDLEVQKGLRLSPQDTLRFTALRELFEETGILLGQTDLAHDELRAKPSAFIEAILQKRLSLHFDRLFPSGRYLTPDYAPLRFDTQYFTTWTDKEHTLSLSGEVSEARFIAPREAMSQWRASKMVIPSPVRVALSHLSSTTSDNDLSSFTKRSSERAEKSRSIDPVDCGDLGGRWIEVVPGVALVPLRTPTLPPATHTNCALFGEKELVAVDPASPYPDEQRVLDNVLDFLGHSRGSKLKAILLTHHHQDHISGAAYLKKKQGVPVYAHAKTAALVPAGLVDHVIEDGHVFTLDNDRKVSALFTPGHAPGHLCYRDEPSGIVASGDMVASIGTIIIDPSEGDMGEYLASLTRLKESKPSFLIPSHGLTIGDPAHKIDEYIKHRLAREAKVLSALKEKNRAKPQDLLASAYDDTPVALYPLAVRSLLAHLQKLVKDGVVQASSDGVFQVVS